MKTYSKKDVAALLLKARGERPNAALARDIGITRQHLGELLRGTRMPGEKVLSFLGLQVRVIPKQKSA